jgi:hypothetical protein
MEISIHQSYYEIQQKIVLDPLFIPYNNIINPTPQLREHPLHVKLYDMHKNNSKCHWGLVSWKWREKIGASGGFFLDWIKTNPGYDLYFIDPNMIEAAVYKNTFINGDISHPGLLKFTQELLNKLEIDINLLNDGFHPSLFSTCTFWVGNKKFWDRWLTFWRKCLDIVEQDKKMHTFMYGFSRKTHLGHPIINYPFVHERMISIFLSQQKNLKWIQYPFDSNFFHFKITKQFGERNDKGSHIYYRSMYLIQKKLLHCGSNLVVEMPEMQFGHDSPFRFPETYKRTKY